MKQSISIEVDVKEFGASANKEMVLVNHKGKWKCITKDELLKNEYKTIQELKDQVECYRLDNEEMKAKKLELEQKIASFEKALVYYGFKLFEGGNE